MIQHIGPTKTQPYNHGSTLLNSNLLFAFYKKNINKQLDKQNTYKTLNNYFHFNVTLQLKSKKHFLKSITKIPPPSGSGSPARRQLQMFFLGQKQP